MTNLLAQQNLSELSVSVLSETEPSAPLRCSCPACCDPTLVTSGGQNTDGTAQPQTAATHPDSSTIIQSLLGGYSWDSSVITYSFYSDASGGSYYGSETVSEVSEEIKANVRSIIANYIEPYINVDFVEVEDTAQSHGQIRYMFSDGPDYAYAYYPTGSSVGGDVHLTTRYDFPDANASLSTNAFQGGPGTHGFSSIIHETLHALGLKHPGNYNGSGLGQGPFLPGEHDNNTNSVMTYNWPGSSAATMMTYDILALQEIYGAGTKNAGDTVYTFDTVHSFTDGSLAWGDADQTMKLSIWDSDGVDTLDFSALEADTSGYRFDLGEGGMLTAQSAYNNATYTARGDGGTYATSAYGTAIAFNATIENLIGSSSDDEIIGNGAANAILAGAGDDVVNGNGGDDYLDGGLGSDRLSGGDGNDTYVVDRASDVVVEDGTGVDSVIASFSYQLGANLENLELTGTRGLDGTGNGLNNSLVGNVGDNTLMGLAGNDILNGGQGINTLMGGNGNDTLISENGSDTLMGGNGNDTYVVDSADDIIDESGTGTDLVIASVNFSLGDNLENLELGGSDPLNGTGNALNNRLSGNDSNNNLEGLAGDDTLLGLAGDDILNGGQGTNVLIGGEGNDTLLSENGIDTMMGGNGNDIYFVDNASDIVDETDATGIDTVYSRTEFNLSFGDNIENVILIGSDVTSSAGNELNNQIVGNDANNQLFGKVGQDRIDGGQGDDVLRGGGGRDQLTGSTGDDLLVGQWGIDSLSGGQGDDYFVGGRGRDRYQGGEGADVFALSKGRSHDVILDFTSLDQMELPSGVSSNDLSFQQRGDNLLINHGGDRLAVLRDFQLDQMTDTAFV